MVKLIPWPDRRPKRPVIARKIKKYPEKLKRMPHSSEEQNILADELIEWALKDDSLLLEKFPLSKMISPYLFFKLGKSGKNDYFTRAFDFARAACSVRHIEGNHSIDTTVVLRLMRVYNREYHESLIEIEDRAVELKKISDNKEDVNFVINMQQSSSDVKPIDIIDIKKS